MGGRARRRRPPRPSPRLVAGGGLRMRMRMLMLLVLVQLLVGLGLALAAADGAATPAAAAGERKLCTPSPKRRAYVTVLSDPARHLARVRVLGRSLQTHGALADIVVLIPQALVSISDDNGLGVGGRKRGVFASYYTGADDDGTSGRGGGGARGGDDDGNDGDDDGRSGALGHATGGFFGATGLLRVGGDSSAATAGGAAVAEEEEVANMVMLRDKGVVETLHADGLITHVVDEKVLRSVKKKDWEAVLPLFAWSLTPQYDRVVFLSPYAVVEHNVDSLFLCEGLCVADTPSQVTVAVLEPSKSLFDFLKAALLEATSRRRHGGSDRSGSNSGADGIQPSFSDIAAAADAVGRGEPTDIPAARLLEVGHQSRSHVSRRLLTPLAPAVGTTDLATVWQRRRTGVASINDIDNDNDVDDDDEFYDRELARPSPNLRPRLLREQGRMRHRRRLVQSSTTQAEVVARIFSLFHPRISQCQLWSEDGMGLRGGTTAADHARFIMGNPSYVPRCTNFQRTPLSVCHRLPLTFAASARDFSVDSATHKLVCPECLNFTTGQISPNIIVFPADQTPFEPYLFTEKPIYWRWHHYHRMLPSPPPSNTLMLAVFPFISVLFVLYCKSSGQQRGRLDMYSNGSHSSNNGSGSGSGSGSLNGDCVVAGLSVGSSAVGGADSGTSTAVGGTDGETGGGGSGSGSSDRLAALSLPASASLALLALLVGTLWYRISYSVGRAMVKQTWSPGRSTVVSISWLTLGVLTGLLVLDQLSYWCNTRWRSARRDTLIGSAVVLSGMAMAPMSAWRGPAGMFSLCVLLTVVQKVRRWSTLTPGSTSMALGISLPYAIASFLVCEVDQDPVFKSYLLKVMTVVHATVVVGVYILLSGGHKLASSLLNSVLATVSHLWAHILRPQCATRRGVCGAALYLIGAAGLLYCVTMPLRHPLLYPYHCLLSPQGYLSHGYPSFVSPSGSANAGTSSAMGPSAGPGTDGPSGTRLTTRFQPGCSFREVFEAEGTDAWSETFAQFKTCLSVGRDRYWTVEGDVEDRCNTAAQFVFLLDTHAPDYCVYSPTSALHLSQRSIPSEFCSETEYFQLRPTHFGTLAYQALGYVGRFFSDAFYADRVLMPAILMFATAVLVMRLSEERRPGLSLSLRLFLLYLGCIVLQGWAAQLFGGWTSYIGRARANFETVEAMQSPVSSMFWWPSPASHRTCPTRLWVMAATETLLSPIIFFAVFGYAASCMHSACCSRSSSASCAGGSVAPQGGFNQRQRVGTTFLREREGRHIDNAGYHHRDGDRNGWTDAPLERADSLTEDDTHTPAISITSSELVATGRSASSTGRSVTNIVSSPTLSSTTVEAATSNGSAVVASSASVAMTGAASSTGASEPVPGRGGRGGAEGGGQGAATSAAGKPTTASTAATASGTGASSSSSSSSGSSTAPSTAGGGTDLLSRHSLSEPGAQSSSSGNIPARPAANATLVKRPLLALRARELAEATYAAVAVMLLRTIVAMFFPMESVLASEKIRQVCDPFQRRFSLFDPSHSFLDMHIICPIMVTALLLHHGVTFWVRATGALFAAFSLLAVWSTTSNALVPLAIALLVCHASLWAVALILQRGVMRVPSSWARISISVR